MKRVRRSSYRKRREKSRCPAQSSAPTKERQRERTDVFARKEREIQTETQRTA